MNWHDDVDLSLIKNTRQQGDIGVAAAHLYYVKNGYSVFVPTTESTPHDLIAVRGSEVLRVQCKTSTVRKSRGASFSVGVSTSGGNRSWNGSKKLLTSESCDVVFIWCSNESLWEVPISYAAHRASLVVGKGTLQYHVGGPPPPIGSVRQRGRVLTAGKTPNVCAAEECTTEIYRTSTHCKSHANMLRENKPRRKFAVSWPSDEDLIVSLKVSNYVQVSKRLGVSDNAVRKHLRVRGYNTKTLEKI